MKKEHEKKPYVTPAFKSKKLQYQPNLLQNSGNGYGGTYSMSEFPRDIGA
jgi:hypothetical protein